MVMANSEGLKIARFLMVLGSFAPLFVLWAIQGSKIVDDAVWWSVCGALAIIPNLVLWFRLLIVRREQDKQRLTVAGAEDHREHLITYLFATLLPFYTAPMESSRHLISVALGVTFIVFLFWRMNLHYMNLAFAVAGYNLFTIDRPKGRFTSEDQRQGRQGQVLQSNIPAYRAKISVSTCDDCVLKIDLFNGIKQ